MEQMIKTGVNKENVLRLFEEYLETAQGAEYIGKPFAWALYQTWKAVDVNEKWRNR